MILIFPLDFISPSSDLSPPIPLHKGRRNEGPPGGSLGLSKCPLDKTGVGQAIALPVASDGRTSAYIVSAFPIHSTSFVAKLLRSLTINVS